MFRCIFPVLGQKGFRRSSSATFCSTFCSSWLQFGDTGIIAFVALGWSRMPPFRRSSTQAADWRWGAQATPDTPAAYLPSFVLHPMPPGAYMLGGASQPGPRSAVQATCSVQAGYALPSPPPFPRHGFANQRRPHPEQPARPVAHPPVRDRVSNTRIEFNPDAKPFVGSLRGVASAAAPAIVKEAMDTGNTGNSRSLSTCKFPACRVATKVTVMQEACVGHQC